MQCNGVKWPILPGASLLACRVGELGCLRVKHQCWELSGKRLGSHFPLLWFRWFFFFGFDYLIDFVEIFVWLFGFVLFLIERWDFSSMW